MKKLYREIPKFRVRSFRVFLVSMNKIKHILSLQSNIIEALLATALVSGLYRGNTFKLPIQNIRYTCMGGAVGVDFLTVLAHYILKYNSR